MSTNWRQLYISGQKGRDNGDKASNGAAAVFCVRVYEDTLTWLYSCIFVIMTQAFISRMNNVLIYKFEVKQIHVMLDNVRFILTRALYSKVDIKLCNTICRDLNIYIYLV